MKIYVNPAEEQWKKLLRRPVSKVLGNKSIIPEVFEHVRTTGDQALRNYTEHFDNVCITDWKVRPDEFTRAETLLDEVLKSAIDIAAGNIRKFHAVQLVEEPVVETFPGVKCWRKCVPVDSVGLYIPGGTAPLFSTVLMLGIPAKIAACRKRVLCTPPQPDGSVHPAILYAAKLAGITEVYRVGGIQAIAAMTFGTESIPAVDKLFGPGNSFVTAAKQHAQQLGVAIDLPAGPSELLVAADETIPAEYVAADLLSQAEHGSDSQVVFITENELYANSVVNALGRQLESLPRKAFASGAVKNSVAVVIPVERWPEIINWYAPEHLIVAGKYETELIQNIRNAGSVFLGEYTAESFGDYASGTNHTLPTSGYARAYSGVSVDAFVRKITYQRVEREGLELLGPVVMKMAEAEQLEAHVKSIGIRLENVKSGAWNG